MSKLICLLQYRKREKLTKKRIKMTKLVNANSRNMNKILKSKNTLYLFLILLLVAFVQCGGSIDNQLEKIAKESNKECPKMLDQWTRLDSCAAYPNKNYKYFHTIVSGGVVVDRTKFESNFKHVIISIIRTNPGMKFMRENEVTLHYHYIDEVDGSQASIVVTPEEYKN